MKVYDPAERIAYVHLASQVPRRGIPARTDEGTPDRLPAGYANQSPRTRVRRETGPSESRAARESVAGAGGDRLPAPRTGKRDDSAICPA